MKRELLLNKSNPNSQLNIEKLTVCLVYFLSIANLLTIDMILIIITATNRAAYTTCSMHGSPID